MGKSERRSDTGKADVCLDEQVLGDEVLDTAGLATKEETRACAISTHEHRHGRVWDVRQNRYDAMRF